MTLGQVVLKRLFMGDNLIVKMVLKRPFISDTGKDLALHIHFSSIQETEL